MLAIGAAARDRRFHREAQLYPSFGGRPLRQRALGHPVIVALALAVGSVSVALTVIPASGSAQEAAAPALSSGPQGDVRTTDKTDRLKRPVLQLGCDGVWGNEPLECLLQTA